jgi:hypothetical protein
MNKLFKNIAGFFILMAWLIITAHLIIPHDHHSTDLCGKMEDKCPLNDGKTRPDHGFPMHCHAFNDLVAEKFVKPVLTRNIQYHDFSIPDFSDIVKDQVSLTTISACQKKISNIDYFGLSSLRAPPLV